MLGQFFFDDQHLDAVAQPQREQARIVIRKTVVGINFDRARHFTRARKKALQVQSPSTTAVPFPSVFVAAALPSIISFTATLGRSLSP